MRLSRIQIENFRNFRSLAMPLGDNVVVLGENQIGKTNLLFALRLLLDPSLPDSMRRLRLDDFWDGLERPLSPDDQIEISAEFRGFEDSENLLAVLADSLVSPDPMVARITYRYGPRPDLGRPPECEADYDFSVFGGDRPENRISYELRRWMPMDVFPALRDAESDLARWRRSPFRPLLDRAAREVDKDELNTIAGEIEETTARITELEELSALIDDVNLRLETMTGTTNVLSTTLGFAPTDPERLLRALQLMIDSGKRGIGGASLGTANILYLALKELEHQHLIAEGERQHTVLAIEEPEAHLHPHLQRRIFRSFLRARDDDKNKPQSRSIILTTHSPNIASVVPLRDVAVLQTAPDGGHTTGRSLADVELEDAELDDLERYLDVTRGELFFANGVILVEGDAERFLLPTLARLRNPSVDFDAMGVSVCSVAGTNFAPYVKLLGPNGLDRPFAVLTDLDPVIVDAENEGSDATNEEVDELGDEYEGLHLGQARVVNLMWHLMDETEWNESTNEQVLNHGPDRGIFLNSHTFEVDLFERGASEEFFEVVKSLTSNKRMIERFDALVELPDSIHSNVETFLSDISSIGKGRFAQRLAAVLSNRKSDICPPYVGSAFDHLISKLS